MNHNARATLLHRCHHLVNVCHYPIEAVADVLGVSNHIVQRALEDVKAAGLPKPPRNLDLLVYPCACGKGMMRKKDDIGCPQCWDNIVLGNV